MQNRFSTVLVILILAALPAIGAAATSWNGQLNDADGKPVNGAVIHLHLSASGHMLTATSNQNGKFTFVELNAGSYELSVQANGKEWKAAAPYVVKDESAIVTPLQLHVDLAPAVQHLVAHADQPVVAADDPQRDRDEDDEENSKQHASYP